MQIKIDTTLYISTPSNLKLYDKNVTALASNVDFAVKLVIFGWGSQD